MSIGNSKEGKYDSIKVLKGLTGIQVRPGMYVGDVSTNEAAINCVWEVISNSFDEHVSGYGDEILINRCGDFWSVRDQGRGIPNEWNNDENKLDLELAFSFIHAGGKFDSDNYRFSSGLHGVGITVLNALSSFVICLSVRKNRAVLITFKEGVTKKYFIYQKEYFRTGTWIIFKLNPKYLAERSIPQDLIKRKLEFLTYVSSGLSIKLEDENSREIISNKDGVKLLVNNSVHGLKEVVQPFHMFCETNYGRAEVYFSWFYSDRDHFIGVTNGLEQNLGGTHVNQIYMELKILLSKIEPTLTTSSIREGLNGIVSIFISDSQYSSQTKEKLTSAQGRKIVKKLFEKNQNYLLKRKKDLEKIAVHLKSLAKKRLEYLQSKVIETVDSQHSILPGKLLDCLTKDLSINEVLIAEGDSAGATAKMARDKLYQAVLPIQGKIINVAKAKIRKVVNFEGVKNIVSSIGTGIGGNFDYSKLRYGKIILMSDADADGFQIKALISALFFKFMRPIIEKGHLYVANPPLFKLNVGKKENFFLDRGSLEKFLWTSEGLNLNLLEDYRSLQLDLEEEIEFKILEQHVTNKISNSLKQDNKIIKLLYGNGKNAIYKVGYESNSRFLIFRRKSIEIAKRLFEKVSLLKIKTILDLNSKNLKRFKGLGQMNYNELWDRVMDPLKREIYRVIIVNKESAEINFERVMGGSPLWRKSLVNDPNISSYDLDL